MQTIPTVSLGLFPVQKIYKFCLAFWDFPASLEEVEIKNMNQRRPMGDMLSVFQQMVTWKKELGMSMWLDITELDQL